MFTNFQYGIWSRTDQTAHAWRAQKTERKALKSKYENSAWASYRFEKTKENVGVYRAFVRLIEHNDGVLRQVWINKTLTQQHTVCHVLNHRLGTGAVFKSNCVADLTTQTPTCTSTNSTLSHSTNWTPVQMYWVTFFTKSVLSSYNDNARPQRKAARVT